MDKLWYIHVKEYYLAIKKNELHVEQYNIDESQKYA